MNYKEFFNKKKVTVIGLGPHGEMVADIKFLLRNKADVSLYDMRSEKRLRNFLMDLRDVGLEKYAFGNIDQNVILGSDLIILSPEISKKSLFLKKAIQAEKVIEYPDTLFFKLSPPITLIGVMGLYGKTTVAHMIYSVLKKSFLDYKDQGLFFIDPDSTNGALLHLKKIKKGDVVLARIPTNLLYFYHEIRISPHVAVVTSPVPFDILDSQTYNNFIVAPDEVVDSMRSENNILSKAKMLRTRGNSLPIDWDILPKSSHERENIALVLQTSELFKVSPDTVKEVYQKFSGLRGCMEFVKKVAGIEFYNDASSITPEATISAMHSLSLNKNLILILGGAYTGYDYSEMVKKIPEFVNTVILLPGSGTLGIRKDLEKFEDTILIQALALEDAIKESMKIAKKGDRVVFSPAFDAVGVDVSRKERGEKFVRAVRGL